MLKEGFYEDAIFRFVMTFGDNFPKELPTIRFTTPVYHPLVSEEGLLDTGALFPNWRYEIGRQLLDVLTRLRAVFSDKAYFEAEDSVNPGAAHLFKSEPDAFLQKTTECARLSRKEFMQLPPDCPYRFDKVQKLPEDVRSILENPQVRLADRSGREEEAAATGHREEDPRCP